VLPWLLLAVHRGVRERGWRWPAAGSWRGAGVSVLWLVMPGGGWTRAASPALRRRAAVLLRHRERTGCLIGT
jgi:hypothetical protein